jgi:hypothetical protein
MAIACIIVIILIILCLLRRSNAHCHRASGYSSSPEILSAGINRNRWSSKETDQNNVDLYEVTSDPSFRGRLPDNFQPNHTANMWKSTGSSFTGETVDEIVTPIITQHELISNCQKQCWKNAVSRMDKTKYE